MTVSFHVFADLDELQSNPIGMLLRRTEFFLGEKSEDVILQNDKNVWTNRSQSLANLTLSLIGSVISSPILPSSP